MTSVVLASGIALVAGLLIMVSGFRRVPAKPRQQRRRSIEPPSPTKVLVVTVSTLGVLAFTRWPVAAAAAGIAVAVLMSASERQTTKIDAGAKAEALATWTEMLRDATGTPRGIEGVLVATVSTAPDAIKPHVQALARRLPYESLDDALGMLARDLDHPLGDMVVTALRLSAATGARQVQRVLDDLVIVAREEARMHTRVEVSRARPRAQMRILVIMMAIFLSLVIVFARPFLEPYGTIFGQVVLLIVCLIWAASIWLMTRFGRARPFERFIPEEAVAT